MLNFTELKEYFAHNNFNWLANGGYSFFGLIILNDNYPKEWNNKQKSFRTIIETVINIVKNFEAAESKFHYIPEMQKIILMIYN